VLWWANDPRRLDARARTAVGDGANDVYLSAVSVWEAELESAAGRLSMPAPLDETAREAGFAELPVRWADAKRAASLPPLHRDPFDRMLVAQALEEHLVLVTRDPAIAQYAVLTMRA
jgi:PIN domain nuclease of toxin-antitoxin system